MDHRPCVERERLQRAGGRVTKGWGGSRRDVKTGPERLWLQDLQMPGIMVSRSLGDEIASGVGCIPVPDVVVRPLREGDRLVILASDGVWDMLGNEEVMAVAAKSLQQFSEGEGAEVAAAAAAGAGAGLEKEEEGGEELKCCSRAIASALLESALQKWGEKGLSDNVGLIAVVIKDTLSLRAQMASGG